MLSQSFFVFKDDRLPDVLFDVMLTFCTSAEIVGWTAEAVRTKDKLAPKLLQLAKSIQMDFKTMTHMEMFWASERLLTIPTPPQRFQGIDFESAMFWLLHEQFISLFTKTTDVMYCEWLEIDRAMMQGRVKPFEHSTQMCAAITHAFFCECTVATRFYIQRKLWSFANALTLESKTTCVIVNCPCR